MAARLHPGATSFDELHALDYLEYAYLQGGRDAEADGVLQQIGRVATLDVPNFAAAYALAAVPARHALERRDWARAAALTLAPSSFPWAQFPHAEAIVVFARAVGAARQSDLPTARIAVSHLQELEDRLRAKNDSYWGDQVRILGGQASAIVAQSEGRAEEAVRLMRAAADLEDVTDKSPVTPGSILPARETLADLLLETGDAAGALVAYDASLRVAPGRYHSLAGAARAAEAAGDAARAKGYYALLVKQCGRADASRLEVTKARAALSGVVRR